MKQVNSLLAQNGDLSGRLVVVMDFDRTITDPCVHWKHECHGLLSMSPLGDAFQAAYSDLTDFEKYGLPPLKQPWPAHYQKEKWWQHAHMLVVKHGFRRPMLDHIIGLAEQQQADDLAARGAAKPEGSGRSTSSPSHANSSSKVAYMFRPGVHEFFALCRERGVPVLVVSAGISDLIERILQRNGLWSDNVHVHSNRMVFGVDGDTDVLAAFEPECRDGMPVCSYSKGLSYQRCPEFFSKHTQRDVLVVIGDRTRDAHVRDGVPCSVDLKFGFFDFDRENTPNFDHVLDEFKSAFDVLLMGVDTSFSSINKMLHAWTGGGGLEGRGSRDGPERGN